MGRSSFSGRLLGLLRRNGGVAEEEIAEIVELFRILADGSFMCLNIHWLGLARWVREWRIVGIEA